MKKFSFIGLLLFSMIYASCEKLPALDKITTLDWYDDGSLLYYTTQNTAVFKNLGGNYNDYYQFSDRQDFNGNILTGIHRMDGTVVLYNLKPSTTYYYRYVEKDGLGGLKASPAESFQTKDENFKMVSVTDNLKYYDSWNGYTVNFDYGITNNAYPEGFSYGFSGMLYYQLSSEDNITQSVFVLGRDRIYYDMYISSFQSEKMTYWLVLYNNPSTKKENLSDDMIVYQSEKKTINLTRDK